MHYNLVSVDGNPSSVMSYVTKCMRKEAFTRFAIEQYQNRCTSGDYAYLLRESMKMLAMCNEHRKRVKENEESLCYKKTITPTPNMKE